MRNYLQTNQEVTMCRRRLHFFYKCKSNNCSARQIFDGSWLESKVPTYIHILTLFHVLMWLHCNLFLCLMYLQLSVYYSEDIFFLSFLSRSWKFQLQTSLETLLRDQPYSWSLSSTKMTTGPFSKRHITQEKCLRDPLQVGDIDVLKGPGVKGAVIGFGQTTLSRSLSRL